MNSFEPRDFSSVDGAAHPSTAIVYLDDVSALDVVMSYKRQTYAALGAEPGAHLLDVGCGTGDDACALAGMVGNEGDVIGLDSSATMIAEAKKRTEGLALPVEFRIGDARGLEFGDATFDGCRADRVMQHLDDPGTAVSELVRVVKPRGRIVVSEPDWETLVVDTPDRPLTRRILNTLCDSLANGWIARRLPALLRNAGLQQIAVQPITLVLTDLKAARLLLQLGHATAHASDAGVITDEAAAAWQASLEEAGQEGRFFASITGFIVSGRKS